MEKAVTWTEKEGTVEKLRWENKCRRHLSLYTESQEQSHTEVEVRPLRVFFLRHPSHPTLTTNIAVYKAGLFLVKPMNKQCVRRRELPLRNSDPVFPMQWTVCLARTAFSPATISCLCLKGSTKKEIFID